MISYLKNIRFGGDKVIWRTVLLLSLFSILAIYSSVSAMAYARNTSTSSFLIRHIVYISIGFVMMFVMHRIPVALFKKFSRIALYASIGALVYMLLGGVTLNDGQRWISLLGLTFQPADFAKISIVLYLASTLENNDFNNFRDVIRKIVIPVGLVCFLIFIGNISTSLLLGATCLSILFIGGLNMKHILKIVGIGMAVGIILVIMGLTLKWPPRVATAVNRITTYTQNNDDANNNSKKLSDDFQAEQAKIAVASGGLFGKGPGNSTQRYFLPHPYSDFVYAIIIEEYGLVVGFFVLLAYMVLLYRAAIIAKKCTRIFSSVIVLGLMLMIVFQAMVNMGVSVGLFPVTGQPLPFVSMGGSSMMFIGIAFGIILSVSRTADQQEAEELTNEDELTENNEVEYEYE